MIQIFIWLYTILSWSGVFRGYYWLLALHEVIARKHSSSQHGQGLKSFLAEFHIEPHSFIDDLKPWLSGDYVHKVVIEDGRFILHLLNGTMNVYKIDDCTINQVEKVCADLIQKGVIVEKYCEDKNG